MLQVSKEKLKRFGKMLLNKENILKREIPAYLKWIRYYLDFIHKFNYDQTTPASLELFIRKLAEKRQSSHQRNQAFHAVELYQKYLERFKVPKKTRSKVKDRQLDWNNALARFADEISIRQFSPSTFKSYRGWILKFNTFTSAKELSEVSDSEVKKNFNLAGSEKKCGAVYSESGF